MNERKFRYNTELHNYKICTRAYVELQLEWELAKSEVAWLSTEHKIRKSNLIASSGKYRENQILDKRPLYWLIWSRK